MNIWTLRNKLKNVEKASMQAAPAPVVEAPKPALGLDALLTAEEAPAAPKMQQENCGLNDLFDMNDSDIREMSPKLTFSGFKKKMN